jgi:pseudaminic acid biosynthesis-associated methylase
MSEQENFWSGAFGDEYTRRNAVDWCSRVPFWSDVLKLTCPRSVLEVGCNAGWNLMAIRQANATINTFGIDVNHKAIELARENSIHAGKVPLERMSGMQFDLAFTAGVLIHVAPRDLDGVMRGIISASRRWILAVEYEAPFEQEVEYRGHAGQLWKRPFGKLYENMGLELARAWPAPEFDRCQAWLLEKP